jgi:hypothetical protein
MRAMKRLAAIAVLTVALQSSAAAQVQFYNGDFNGVDGLSSEVNTSITQAMVYESFIVTGGGVNVTGIFGNFLTDVAFTTASWEVRSGVSGGNGGSLLFSGPVQGAPSSPLRAVRTVSTPTSTGARSSTRPSSATISSRTVRQSTTTPSASERWLNPPFPNPQP